MLCTKYRIIHESCTSSYKYTRQWILPTDVQRETKLSFYNRKIVKQVFRKSTYPKEGGL